MAVKDTSSSLFLIAIKESFIALLPFIFVNSLLALIVALVDVWQPSWQGSAAYAWLSQFGRLLFSFFPLMALLSLSFHFAKYLHVSAVVVASLSIGSQIALHIHGSEAIDLSNGFDFLFGDARAIITPILVAYLLQRLMAIKALNLLQSTSLSSYLKLHLNLFIPLILCFVLVTTGIYWVGELLGMVLSPLVDSLAASSTLFQLFVRVLATHVLWCFGVHGDIAYMLVLGVDNGLQQVAPNLTLSQFTDLFVLLGGSGATHSLLIALFIASKDKNAVNVAKLALPFALFNINEILIYGLPIIFNPRLMLPFVLVPLFNTLIGSLLIVSGWVSFAGNDFAWITPIFLNGYVAGGTLALPLVQLLLVCAGVFIYLPFVRRYSLLVGNKGFERDLIKRVQLQQDIEKISERNYARQQSEDLAANLNLEKTIKAVLNGELLLYYQPKISLSDRRVVGYEALLRLRNERGQVEGPYFIPAFDQAGYSNLIDSFVIRRLRDDLQAWAKQGFYPRVSINLNPNSVLSQDVQSMLIELLGDMADRVDIEVLESMFVADLNAVEASMAHLRQYGFSFVLDDFGTGFSSISLLSKITIDGVKLDRSILENTGNHKGQVLYRHTCMLCRSLGFNLVAEGVETKAEEAFVASAGVSTVQGWLYAKAMPAAEAKRYALLQESFSEQTVDSRGESKAELKTEVKTDVKAGLKPEPKIE
ncbi:EAL domain-containing protein [Shewanella rhizosphaerae]|uniref:EAL domain-containing protein n=1 Tax=Shewanella rhizosphaerae TaxID=2864207 RepID=UPI001C65DAC4|nr:EAL domain-containing protein [Shewanella rhizosphaerae]QYK13826.1 EAL domain-containing protein [Shewanella rhizosphaerae]